MKPLLMNFSRLAAQKQRRRDWIVLFISLLLLAFVAREAMTLQQQLEQKAMENTPQTRDLTVITQIDPAQQKLARQMAESLNLPWYELLEAMESVKQQHPEVYLEAILPDARKHQIVMAGQVKQLDLLLAYIDDLNQHPLFSDALLVNQQQSEQSQGMDFTFKLVWRDE